MGTGGKKLIVADTGPPSHGLGGNPTTPSTGVTGLGGKKRLVPPVVTCPLIDQVCESRALNENVTSVVEASCQIIDALPLPAAKAQLLPDLYLLGVKLHENSPAAGQGEEHEALPAPAKL